MVLATRLLDEAEPTCAAAALLAPGADRRPGPDRRDRRCGPGLGPWDGPHDHHREAHRARGRTPPAPRPGSPPRAAGRLGADRRRVAARRPSHPGRIPEVDQAPRAHDHGSRPDRGRGDRQLPGPHRRPARGGLRPDGHPPRRLRRNGGRHRRGLQRPGHDRPLAGRALPGPHPGRPRPERRVHAGRLRGGRRGPGPAGRAPAGRARRA